MPKIVTQESFILKCYSKHKSAYDLSKVVYTAGRDRIEVVCPEHGSFFPTANNFANNGTGCPTCSGRGVDWVSRFREVHGDTYSYPDFVYVDRNMKVAIHCKKHGEFMQSPGNHYYLKQGCPRCKGAKIQATKRLPFLEFIRRANEVHASAFTYKCKDWRNMLQSKIDIVCEHGIYQQTAVNHLAGKIPCQKCGNMKSGPEESVADFLALFTPVERRNRSILAPKEIDIWLPEYNIGVEFHGLFWHTTNRVGKLHKEKWQMAQQAKIRLVQIFEDEWLNKQDIVKARLLAFLGKAEKRDARKLELRTVQWKDAKAFLVSTHIQGAGPVGTAYGLYEGETLIAIATFGKSRSGAMTGARKEGEYEVLRYASTGTVRGGFTKLFARFKKDFAPEVVVSYCDLRYGTGGLYEAAGFSLSSITEPDYWWVPQGKVERVARYVVQKHKMASVDHPLNAFYAPHKTEAQICEEAGWQKIHGVGNQKWVWKST